MAFFRIAKQYISRVLSERRERAPIRKSEQADKGLVLAFKNKKFPAWRQLKYLKEVLTFKERAALEAMTGILLLSLLFLGAVWYFDHTEVIAYPGGEYTEGLVGAPQVINPILPSGNDVDGDIGRLVYSGLTRENLKYEYVPDLAERFEISADQKTYTFYLRQGIKWHDGVDFSADDILFTIATIQNPAVKSPLRDIWRNVKAEKIDDNTVRFTLAEASAPFISYLTVGILPEHLWRDIPISGFNLTDLNLRPVGTGPFVFTSFSRDRRGIIKSYILSANGDYYAAKPNIQKITFKFFPDPNSAVAALNNKGVDGVAFVGGDLKSLIVRRDVNYHDLRLPEYTALFFNLKRDAVKDKNFRLALALAIDREKLASVGLAGAVRPIWGLFGNTPFAVSETVPAPDLAKAGELLDGLGWPMGEDGLRHKITVTKVVKTVNRKKVAEEEKKDEILTVTITTVPGKENIDAANFIKSSWEGAGIKTEIKTVANENIKKDVIQPRDFDILLYGEILGRDFDPFLFWHTTQTGETGLNLSGYSNRDLDQLLEQAMKTNVFTAKAEKYKAAEEILAKDIPAIFLWAPIYSYTVDKSVKGIDLISSAAPSDRFINVTEWYMKTKRMWE